CRVLRRWLLNPSSILGASTKNSRQLAVSSRQSTAEQSADLRGFHGLRNQATKRHIRHKSRTLTTSSLSSGRRRAVSEKNSSAVQRLWFVHLVPFCGLLVFVPICVICVICG